jgi:hypothetical protein
MLCFANAVFCRMLGWQHKARHCKTNSEKCFKSTKSILQLWVLFDGGLGVGARSKTFRHLDLFKGLTMFRALPCLMALFLALTLTDDRRVMLFSLLGFARL